MNPLDSPKTALEASVHEGWAGYMLNVIPVDPGLVECRPWDPGHISIWRIVGRPMNVVVDELNCSNKSRAHC